MSVLKELPDVQSMGDFRGIELQLAGVRDLRLPLAMDFGDGKSQRVDATIALGVNVPSCSRGTHMSRLVEVWLKHSYPGNEQDCLLSPVCISSIQPLAIGSPLNAILLETCRSLESTYAYSKVDFIYYLEHRAPVTGVSAPLAIDCSYSAWIKIAGLSAICEQMVTVKIPVSTLCPCSKAISNHGAHNQRAILSASIKLKDLENLSNPIQLGKIISLLEDCASCRVFTVLKRLDEKCVTEVQSENAKFVEDVARDAVFALRSVVQIKGFSVDVLSLESIHAHNAWAFHQENFAWEDWIRP